MANKLLNFRCPDELLTAIEAYGVENYPSQQGKLGYDQSKTVRDILVEGLKALTDGQVLLDRDEIVKQQQSKSDNSIDLEALEDRLLVKLGEKLQSLAEELAQKK